MNPTSGKTRPRRYLLTISVAVTWLVVVGGVMLMLLNFSNMPGVAGATPVRWPVASRISFDPSQPNLILFAHPHCPCTQATIRELEILMADCAGKLSAQVWFIKPAGTAGDWTNTVLWRNAAAIPGVTVHCDEGVVEAQRFHAETSGQTLLYDRGGGLLFQGGITISRGHSGDNPGRVAVAALLEQKLPPDIQTPVYGCPLSATECQPGEVVCEP